MQEMTIVILICQTPTFSGPKKTLMPLRNFQLDQSALADFHIKSVDTNFLDLDFRHNSKVYQCWFMGK